MVKRKRKKKKVKTKKRVRKKKYPKLFHPRPNVLVHPRPNVLGSVLLAEREDGCTMHANLSWRVGTGKFSLDELHVGCHAREPRNETAAQMQERLLQEWPDNKYESSYMWSDGHMDNEWGYRQRLSKQTRAAIRHAFAWMRKHKIRIK